MHQDGKEKSYEHYIFLFLRHLELAFHMSSPVSFFLDYHSSTFEGWHADLAFNPRYYCERSIPDV
jgi:hypothetical protein